MWDRGTTEPGAAVAAQGLTKRYGSALAVDGLDLDIRASEFFGLLGPNGSGKTTTIHMLSTLIRPSAGTARVAGHDVLAAPVAVRRSIGVVFQESALDRNLSVEENLRFAGRLHDLAAADIRRRSDDLLALFGLSAKRRQSVAQLSGGMRRALDIARGVIHYPRILFLDEPTIGLDVPNRRAIWRFIARLRAETGMTVLLTTHYLEEADDCDRVAFIKDGRIVAAGAPRALVDDLAGQILEVEGEELEQLARRLAPKLGPALNDGQRLSFRIRGAAGELAALQTELASAAAAVRLRRPNLNDVFLWVNAPDRRPVTARAAAQ